MVNEGVRSLSRIGAQHLSMSTLEAPCGHKSAAAPSLRHAALEISESPGLAARVQGLAIASGLSRQRTGLSVFSIMWAATFRPTSSLVRMANL
jgi:hypothetical protein